MTGMRPTMLEPARSVTRHVGARRARLEDRPLLTGGGCYTDDIELPRMAHAAIIRSPVANGMVRRIRSDRLTTPVDLVLGPDEIAAATDPYRVLWIMPNQWQTERPLYDGRVRFVGDPIGVVVAADRYAAEDALDELDVLIDELPPVVGLDAALADERLVYPDHDTNLMAHWSAGDDDAHTDAVFAAADRTLSIPLRIGRVAGVPIEPRGIVVDPGRPGWDGLPDKITVWTSTQAPHAVRDAIAEVCRLPQHRIRVIGPDVGGGFGVKDHIYEDELMVVLAAIRLGRPVKWIEDRRESLTTTTQARDERHVVEVAYDDDGALRGIRVAADRDCGAYFSIFGAGPLFAMTGTIGGPYTWDAVTAHARAFATNTCPTHSYRGFGQAQATFVRELAVDAVAADLGMDPFDLRLRNCITPDQQPFPLRTGPMFYDDGDYPESLRRARALAAAWPDPPEDGRRWGTACSINIQQAGVGPSQGNPHVGLSIGSWESTTIRMERDGTVRVYVGVSSHGQGHATTFAQLVADRLGIDPSQVEIIHSDTDVAPYSAYGTAASRSIAVGGGATVRAAEQLASRLVSLAALLLETDPTNVMFLDGDAVSRDDPSRRLPLAAVADRAWQGWGIPEGYEAGLVEHAVYEPPEFTWSYSTHVCRLAVDTTTGQIEIDRYAMVLDCGTVVNPTIVEGQLHGGMVQGLGPALCEEVLVDDAGVPLTTTLLDYLIPSSAIVPDMQVELMEIPSPHTPGGMKGMGEGGTNGAFSCIANAVRAALPEHADRLTRTPFTPSRVWDAVHTEGTP